MTPTVSAPPTLAEERPEIAAPGAAGDPTAAAERTGGPSPARWRPGTKGAKQFARKFLAPIAGIAVFLALWAAVAPTVKTSLGSLPGPAQVVSAAGDLYEEWQADRDKKAEFYAAQDKRNDALIAQGKENQVRDFEYSGPPTFVDQVWTSLQTVGLGFLLATVVAVPLGLISGLSKTFHSAINPLIQIFRPVSPLAWLPIVTMVVSATIKGSDPFLAKSFVISAVVVCLCSMWPTVINTAVGAASVDQDLLNVSRVLKLSWFQKLKKLVLPSALPYIFTGMRLSLGVGWMVLIAAEMLSQNPGLGKFVWDEFQNGNTESLARIMFAVFVIGLIGFLLDRLMGTVQRLVSRNHRMA
jgi:nitrate/nitrite transport system permease protein